MIILSVGVFYVVFFYYAVAQNRQRELRVASHDPLADRPVLSSTYGH